MAPGRYTELFFLDEATALAAGHRPCGECRRGDYRRFRAAWLAGNADRGCASDARIDAIDGELHRDRLTADGAQRTFPARLDDLPDGVFVERAPAPDAGSAGAVSAGVPLLVWAGALWPWSADGYGAPQTLRSADVVTVLTPASTVRAIAAGFTPAVHRTAAGGQAPRP
jgi:hypothetical protein